MAKTSLALRNIIFPIKLRKSTCSEGNLTLITWSKKNMGWRGCHTIQSPNQLKSPLPDYLHSVKASFILWTQKCRSSVFLVQPYQCWEGGIIIFPSTLALPLQPRTQTGTQLAFTTVDSFPTCCPLGTPGSFLQSCFLIQAVPSLYWSMASDVLGAELWICLCWDSWVISQAHLCRPSKYLWMAVLSSAYPCVVFLQFPKSAFWPVNPITDDAFKQHPSFIVTWVTLLVNKQLAGLFTVDPYLFSLMIQSVFHSISPHLSNFTTRMSK